MEESDEDMDEKPYRTVSIGAGPRSSLPPTHFNRPSTANNIKYTNNPMSPMSSLDTAEWQRKLTQSEVEQQRVKNDMQHHQNQAEHLRNDLSVSQGKLEDIQKRFTEESEKRHQNEVLNSGLKKDLLEARSDNAKLLMSMDDLRSEIHLEGNLEKEVKRLRGLAEVNEKQHLKELNELNMQMRSSEGVVLSLQNKMKTQKSKIESLQGQLENSTDGVKNKQKN